MQYALIKRRETHTKKNREHEVQGKTVFSMHMTALVTCNIARTGLATRFH